MYHDIDTSTTMAIVAMSRGFTCYSEAGGLFIVEIPKQHPITREILPTRVNPLTISDLLKMMGY